MKKQNFTFEEFIGSKARPVSIDWDLPQSQVLPVQHVPTPLTATKHLAGSEKAVWDMARLLIMLGADIAAGQRNISRTGRW